MQISVQESKRNWNGIKKELEWNWNEIGMDFNSHSIPIPFVVNISIPIPFQFRFLEKISIPIPIPIPELELEWNGIPELELEWPQVWHILVYILLLLIWYYHTCFSIFRSSWLGDGSRNKNEENMLQCVVSLLNMY